MVNIYVDAYTSKGSETMVEVKLEFGDVEKQRDGPITATLSIVEPTSGDAIFVKLPRHVLRILGNEMGKLCNDIWDFIPPSTERK